MSSVCREVGGGFVISGGWPFIGIIAHFSLRLMAGNFGGVLSFESNKSCASSQSQLLPSLTSKQSLINHDGNLTVDSTR
jgi:hypothetical protein